MNRLRIFLVVVASLALCAPAWTRQEAKITAGNGTLYLGAFPNRIFIIDEASEKVVGQIPVGSGIPRQLTLSHDRKHFYLMDATFEYIEIIDIAARKTLDTFRLSEDNKKVRIRSYEVDPLERYMILLTKTATKLLDRWEIGPPVLLQYDLKTHKVMRTIPWPDGQERERANIEFSPDGKLMYFFSDDVLIFETTDFKQVDKWEISRPLEDGMGRIEFGPLDRINEEPGFMTGIFTVQDPVQKRRMMGIGRVNLQAKSLDYYTLGPATPVGFALAPDRKRAYGLHQQIGHYEFWTFDLENKRLHGRTVFPGRPRMGLRTSSNGKILYIHVAGNTIDYYDAATYRYLRTLALDGDMTTEMYVMPGKTPGTNDQR